MSSSEPTRRLQDILANVDRIRRHIDKMSAARFAADDKTQDAVERCLERISEAARKLGDRFDTIYPEVEFSKLRQLGSVLRHDYDDIDADILWRTVMERLDPLETACRKESEKG
ncbi:MAG TPA: HepT-like ribonuclease domain-containing protein [Stellaceae bacterium]|nr:HepT-like ribonuclease domain-containing protein [Stellaceae bacterium]